MSHQSTAVFESAVSDVDAAADTGNSAYAQWPPLAVPYVAPNRDVHVGESGWTSDDETLVKTVSSPIIDLGVVSSGDGMSIVRTAPTRLPPGYNGNPAGNHDEPPLTTTGMVSRNGDNASLIQTAPPSVNGVWAQSDGVNRVKSTPTHGVTNAATSDWQLVSPRRQRNVPQRKPQRTRRGQVHGSAENALIRGAPPPKRDFFLSRLSYDTDIEQLKRYIEGKGMHSAQLSLVSHEDSVYNSFKLTVGVQHANLAMSSDVWPQGVCVTRWRSRRQE